MKKIKWGILGTSRISEVMAQAIHDSTTGSLHAIGSRSKQTAKAFAEKFSIPLHYDNYHALLDDAAIDAIYIGLPNHLHKEWILHAARKGKHILCEKPFVVSIDEAHEAIAAAKEHGVLCMEALMYRCHPFTKKLKELIQSQLIGDIKYINAVYTAHIVDVANPTAGGALRNLGCYPLSLIRFLLDAEPIDIQVMGRVNPITKMDNQTNLNLKFANDIIATIFTADDLKMMWQFDVYGTKGTLKVSTNPWLPTMNENHVLIYYPEQEEPEKISISAEKPLYTYQIDAVGQSIIEKDFTRFIGTSLADSLGNTVVIENSLNQLR